MALQSMTGFARASSEADGALVTWEVKSVNGKSAEARFRLPTGFERLEPTFRQKLQKTFARGNFQATLSVARQASEGQLVVNEVLLGQLAGLAQRLQSDHGIAPASADGLLAIRGVLEVPESSESEESRRALDELIAGVFARVLAELEAARTGEGAALGDLLSLHLEQIEGLTLRAEADRSRDPSMIRARLAEQVKLLMETTAGLDEGRLHAEAAILATKADIREEIDRLKTHIASGRNLLAAGGPVGRKLDFLAQEFNRESNTLCSKSNAASVTAIGLELKSVVDQFREQVQNLE
ncbi:MAG: YicC/YloC family endoribonuclease [Rhizobiaceae bacterium]